MSLKDIPEADCKCGHAAERHGIYRGACVELGCECEEYDPDYVDGDEEDERARERAFLRPDDEL